MTGKTHRYFILLASILPPMATVVAIVLTWNHLVGPRDLALLFVFYTLTGFGVTVGFHRLLTHRAFKSAKRTRLALAVLGTAAAEGPPIIWVSHHRRHHDVADQEGDPHSPHLHAANGLRGQLAGLWHAHWGWLFDENLTSEPMRFCPDLVREREMRWISQHFLHIVLAGILLPGVIGLALSGSITGFLTGVLWGGLVRIFLLHHSTYAINSVTHVFGRRSFDTDDHSTNVLWLAIPTFGESFHNNHHAFPTSARHGMRWWEIDTSAMLINALERLHLAWDVVRIPPHRLDTKRIGAVAATAGAADAPSTQPPPEPRRRELVGSRTDRD
jgi:stearoyl-CoA desaturase (Delta-9 desaturase)